MTAVDQRAFDNARSFFLASTRLAAYYKFTIDYQSGVKTKGPKDQTLSIVVVPL